MENLYVDVRAQRGLQVKEVRDSPVHINKGDVKDVLDFGQICLLFCFVSFFFFYEGYHKFSYRSWWCTRHLNT